MKARVLSPVYLLLMALALLLPPLLSPADALHLLGGVDMGKYCRSIAGDGAEAALENQTAYGWYCRKNGQKLPFFVSVTQACRVIHNKPNAVDFLGDFFNPYSWSCYDDAKKLGGVDFEEYCEHLGHKGFKVKGETAYNMYCVNQSDQLVDVLENRSATKACQWTWANPHVIARLLDFNNPNPETWECWW